MIIYWVGQKLLKFFHISRNEKKIFSRKGLLSRSWLFSRISHIIFSKALIKKLLRTSPTMSFKFLMKKKEFKIFPWAPHEGNPIRAQNSITNAISRKKIKIEK